MAFNEWHNETIQVALNFFRHSSDWFLLAQVLTERIWVSSAGRICFIPSEKLVNEKTVHKISCFLYEANSVVMLIFVVMY